MRIDEHVFQTNTHKSADFSKTNTTGVHFEIDDGFYPSMQLLRVMGLTCWKKTKGGVHSADSDVERLILIYCSVVDCKV